MADFFKSHKIDLTLCAVLCAVLAFVGYSYFRHFGIYGDDWGASTYLYQNNLRSAVSMWWHAGSGEIENFRLLAVIIPIIWYGAFHLFGFFGVILINFLLYAGLAILFYFILKQHLSRSAAFLGALLFAIFPTNNAYLWQVTISYALALLAVFGAILLFNKNKFWQSALILACGLLINEAVFFVFFLSVLAPQTQKLSWAGFKPRFKKWLQIVAPMIISYIIFRLALEITGITGGNRATNALHQLHLVAYAMQFAYAIAIDLVIAWGVSLWKILHYHQAIDFAVGVAAALAAWFFSRKLSRSSENISKPLYVIVLGLILICAGRYYGFYYVPSVNVLNLDSRYYFASSVGAAMCFAGLLQWAWDFFAGWKKYIPTVLLCLMVFVAAMSRFEVERDYARAWQNAQKFWQTFLAAIPSLPDKSVLIVNVPARSVDQPVGVSEAMGDLRSLVPLFYGKDELGAGTLGMQSIDVGQSQVCFTSSPFFFDYCVDNARVTGLVWDGGRLIRTYGRWPLSGPNKASLPPNIKKILSVQ